MTEADSAEVKLKKKTNKTPVSGQAGTSVPQSYCKGQRFWSLSYNRKREKCLSEMG